MADLYQQLTDYSTAFRDYLKTATGLPDERIVFGPPDIARRKLRERLERATNVSSKEETVERDKFISYFFPYASPGTSDERMSVQQGMYGGLGYASKKRIFPQNVDLPVQIDIWGGPEQSGPAFVFNMRKKLEFYMYRKARINVQFTDLITKNPSSPQALWDVNCWYDFIRGETSDNSDIESLYVKGANHRATMDLTWLTTFYDDPEEDPVQKLNAIIVEYEESDGSWTEEVIVTTSTTVTSTTVSTTTTPGGDVDTNGAVFIQNVEPTGTGSVGNKQYADSPYNVSLSSFETDTELLTVTIRAFTGYTTYVPVVRVNDLPVTNFAEQSTGQWLGTIQLDLTGRLTIEAVHADGPTYEVPITRVSGPAITDMTFAGYPVDQTEVKEDDTVSVNVTTSTPCDQIEVYDYQACKSKSISVTAGTSHTISVDIADRGSGTVNNQTIRLRCRSATGIWGAPADATDFGTGDGTRTLELNNDYPTISAIAQNDIDYPATQEALKDTEQATVNHTVAFPSGTGTVAYTSGNSQLTITNPSTYEAAKVVTRLAGSYNVTSNNLTITAEKTSNKATASRNAVVYIAHAAQTISISTPYSRLRSSASGEDYTITIASSQKLIEAPTLDALGAGEGTWQGAAFTGGPNSWTRDLQVLDSDTKGTFTFTGLQSKNLAGKIVSTISSGEDYVLGGFVSRTLTIDAWPNREGSIGTQVSDTAKLVAYNNSKGVNYFVDYKATVANEVDKYTITQPTGTANPTGNLLYNCDEANAVSNTSGTATFTIEETS